MQGRMIHHSFRTPILAIMNLCFIIAFGAMAQATETIKTLSPRAKLLENGLRLREEAQKSMDEAFKKRPSIKTPEGKLQKINSLFPNPTLNTTSPKRSAKTGTVKLQAVDEYYVIDPIYFGPSDYHNFMNDVLIETIYEPDADFISVDFSFVDLENQHDYVSIVTANDVECARITGFHPDGLETIFCPGNYLEIRVTTDSSVSGFTHDGFDIEGYTYAIDIGNLDPVAVARADDYTVGVFENVYFNANASYDPDESYGDFIEEYFWDFDDGTTSSQKNPTHHFEDPGVYAVLLTVYDNWGGQDTHEILIYVDDVADPILGHTTINRRSLTFRWEPGDNNTWGYRAGLFAGNREDLSCSDGSILSASTLSIEYLNLNPGTEYTFLLCALNRADYPSLGWLIPVQTLHDGAGITNFQFTAVDHDSIAFSWDRANDSTIEYQVGFAQGNQSSLECTGAPQTNSVDFRANLQAGTIYTIAICARNLDGLLSAPQRWTTVTSVLAPINLTNTLRTSSRLAFSWQAGSPNTSSYRVAFGPESDSNLNCSNGVTQNTTTYTSPNNLLPNTQYKIMVCSLNSAGTMTAAVSQTIRTKANVQAMRIAIRRNSDGTWEVTFPAVANVNYELQYANKVTGPYLDSELSATVIGGSGKFHFVGAEGEPIQFFRIKAEAQ